MSIIKCKNNVKHVCTGVALVCIFHSALLYPATKSYLYIILTYSIFPEQSCYKDRNKQLQTEK